MISVKLSIIYAYGYTCFHSYNIEFGQFAIVFALTAFCIFVAVIKLFSLLYILLRMWAVMLFIILRMLY